jgi:hypothetical protein
MTFSPESILSRFLFFTAAIERSRTPPEFDALLSRLKVALDESKITKREYDVLEFSIVNQRELNAF